MGIIVLLPKTNASSDLLDRMHNDSGEILVPSGVIIAACAGMGLEILTGGEMRASYFARRSRPLTFGKHPFGT